MFFLSILRTFEVGEIYSVFVFNFNCELCAVKMTDIKQMKQQLYLGNCKSAPGILCISIQKKSEMFLDTVLQLALSFCKYLVFFC